MANTGTRKKLNHLTNSFSKLFVQRGQLQLNAHTHSYRVINTELFIFHSVISAFNKITVKAKKREEHSRRASTNTQTQRRLLWEPLGNKQITTSNVFKALTEEQVAHSPRNMENSKKE